MLFVNQVTFVLKKKKLGYPAFWTSWSWQFGPVTEYLSNQYVILFLGVTEFDAPEHSYMLQRLCFVHSF